MLDRVIKVIVVIVIAVLVFWAFSLIVTALSVALGFAYADVALKVIAGLMIIGVCVYIARLWGVSI